MNLNEPYLGINLVHIHDFFSPILDIMALGKVDVIIPLTSQAYTLSAIGRDYEPR